MKQTRRLLLFTFYFPFSARRRARCGQVMILTVLAIGGTILGATTIAGLLMVYQIRQATDIGNSGKAIYAADAGVEWGLFQYFNPGSSHPQPAMPMSNGGSFTIACTPTNDCRDFNTKLIRSVGAAANVQRAFELNLQSSP